MCAATEKEAHDKAGDGAGFFFHGIAHYFLDGMGDHYPGVSNIWEDFQRAKASGAPTVEAGGVGTPDQVRDWIKGFEDVGIDEVMFLVPPTKPEYIMESIELFGEKVLPEFIERDEVAVKAKAERLAPSVERAMARRPADPVIDPSYFFTGAARNWQTKEMVPEIVESLRNRGAALLEESHKRAAN
jgi:hypothetical protein